MQAPPAGLIKAAIEMMSSEEYLKQHAAIILAQEDEVRAACPDETTAFYEGFRIAMQTARLMVASIPAAQAAGIEL